MRTLVLFAVIVAALFAINASPLAGTDVGTAMGAIFWLLLIPLVYFLPAIIAVDRGHHNSTAIGLFNFFLGWTFLGWVIALVWSATAIRPAHCRY
jgi:hypothetical protein